MQLVTFVSSGNYAWQALSIVHVINYYAVKRL
jgi:hypothetical protein